ncbi:methylated-DNA--[protein]-cysteine S-methyltransferase [Salinicola aestuarinus]|uniref:methylated-DNA--[protein]-cysteine S-methyltransferase n=1 Tax=Salinicola aestuarinus TaxID=1949082 RepID=UPI000DA1809D|nr:methylated-DNA--[protein]-cysteine S-methyltransferase [Salinicola aestuarinus]
MARDYFVPPSDAWPGALEIRADTTGITRIDFVSQRQSAARPSKLTQECARQLQAYFAGELERFELALSPQGTDFQQRVWQALAAIPWGETKSYRELAVAIEHPTASRAVGMANARNPLPIIVPCHRVIGTDGTLTGYAGGLARKRWLLEHEGWRETPHRGSRR